MPLTDDEIRGLIAEGKSDEQILAIGQALDAGPSAQPENVGAAFRQAGLGDRAAEAVQTAFEATNVPSALRMAQGRGGKLDIAQLGLMALPAAGAAKAGLGLGKLAGGLAASGLGAGIAQGALGPEARQAGQMIGGETGAKIGGMIPALAGGLLGPGVARNLLGAGKAAATQGLGSAASRLKQMPDLPASGAQAAAVESGEALTPQALKLASEFEARTGIKPTPGQMQFLEGGQARTGLKDAEYRLRQHDLALRTGKEQADKMRQYAERTMEEIAPGSSRTSAAIGGEIQGKAIEQLNRAAHRYEAAEKALIGAPDAGKITLDYVTNLKAGINEIKDAFKAPGGKSALPAEVQGVLKTIEPWTKTAGNIKDAIQLRRVLKGMTSKFQPGTPEYNAVRRIDSAVDDAIEASATKAQKGPLKEFFDASRAYRQAKFSDEAGLVESLAGVDYNKKNALPTRTPEDVVKTIFNSPGNMAPRLLKAAEKGNIPKEAIHQAAANYLLETVQNAQGNIDYGRLQKVWSSLAPSQKSLLFGSNVDKINRLVKDAEALTFLGRYQPPTGASLPVLIPGLERAVKAVPMIGEPLAALTSGGAENLRAISHFRGSPAVATPPTAASRALEAAAIAGQAGGASLQGFPSRQKEAEKRALTMQRALQLMGGQ